MTRRTVDATGQTFCHEPHQYGPANPARWRSWANLMRLHHTQFECPDCGLPAIWRANSTLPAVEPEQLGFDDQQTG